MPATEAMGSPWGGLRGQAGHQQASATLHHEVFLLFRFFILTNDVLEQGLAHFFVKGQLVNIFSFAGHTASAATTQLCCCSTKAAAGIM